MSDERRFEVGSSMVTILFGDITKSDCEILVSSDDYLLSMGGGVSRAIAQAAGPEIRLDTRKSVPRRVGDVVVTSAGALSAKYIFHAITIGDAWEASDVDPGIIVRTATRRVLELAPLLSCSSVAFPAIGSGSAGLSMEVVACQMVEAIFGVLLHESQPMRIELWLKGRGNTDSERALVKFIDAFTSSNFALGPSSHLSGDCELSLDEEDRLSGIRSTLQRLDDRRAELERELVRIITGEVVDIPRVEAIRVQLQQVGALRDMYQAQVDGVVEKTGQAIEGSVFVSSTSKDLQSHRRAVREVLEQLDRTYIGMEDFAPESTRPADMIRRKVVESETYLGIIGMRYGYVDENTGLSMTELEYQQAVASKKELFIFVMDHDAPVLAGMVEMDPGCLAKLNDFKARVLRQHSCGRFLNEEDLALKVELALK